MQLYDVTREVNDGKKRRINLRGIRMIAVHRIGKSIGTTATEICDRFQNDPEVAKYTGGQNPYTFIIGENGAVWQCLPLDDAGSHARRWNSVAVGVALIGDFRKEQPTDAQEKALGGLLVVLCMALALDPLTQIKGHSELPGGSSSPSKVCPGHFLDLDRIRVEVWEDLTGEAQQQPALASIVWST